MLCLVDYREDNACHIDGCKSQSHCDEYTNTCNQLHLFDMMLAKILSETWQKFSIISGHDI